MRQAEVVLVDVPVLRSKNCSILTGGGNKGVPVEWWRVVVDEVQYCETNSVKSVLSTLKRVNFWIISATPFRHGLESLPWVLSFFGPVTCEADDLKRLMLRRDPVQLLDAMDRAGVKPQREVDVPAPPPPKRLRPTRRSA